MRADRQALDQEKEALAAVMEQIEDGITLAVSLVADGSLRMTARGVDVPPEHRATLRPVWPLIGPAMGQMMTLRDRWTRGITRLRDLLTRNKVATELREEARELVADSGERPL